MRCYGKKHHHFTVKQGSEGENVGEGGRRITQRMAVTYDLPNPLLHRGHHSNRRERGVSSVVETHQSQQHVFEIPAPQSAERGDASKCICQ